MRSAVPLAALAIALAPSGCTVAGTAIGAATPRYEAVEWPRSAVTLGARVRVTTRNVGADSAATAKLEGRYGGVRDGLLSVTDDEGREHVLLARDIVDVEVLRGTEWQKGLVLGAAADVLAIAAGVAIASGANVSITTP